MELNNLGYSIGRKIYHNGIHCGRSYTKKQWKHNELLDAKLYANAPEIGRFAKWWCGIKDQPGYKWVKAGMGYKRIKVMEIA
ncbi:hypothetical protein IGV50_004403 [Salmonella enterica subsp. enterica serovar Newport]|nr:hypothetical protein [Salmonella enterica subsp. enterica serovar Newport]